MTQCTCGAEWYGEKECHCAACHKCFSSEKNFDDHRTGDYDTGRRCYTTEEMETLTVGKSGRLRYSQSPQKDGRVVWVSWSAGDKKWWGADD